MPRYKRALPLGDLPSGLLGDDAKLFRFITGLDGAPRVLDDAEAGRLDDPLARLLLRRGTFPRSVGEVLAAVDAFNADPDGLPRQDVFVVGEGSQLAPNQSNVDRHLRFVITRTAANAVPGEVDLLISTAADGDPSTSFLQIIGWDRTQRAFQFYQREPPDRWVWAGSSHHALVDGSRGEGPFDSHVNGGLVMKELKQPWNNWHAQNSGISAALAPAEPSLRALFEQRKPAERLEVDVIKPGIRRWNRARIANAVDAAGTMANVPHYLRQILETTTVNLASSRRASRLAQDVPPLDLPLTFFLNSDAFLDILALEPDIEPLTVARPVYRESLQTFGFALEEGGFRQAGDTFFAFIVPEPAFEDLDLLDQLLNAGLVGRRLAASLLMVDFPNPVFSPRRAALLRHVPASLALGAQHDLSQPVAQQIVAASGGTPAGSPEREFAELWSLPDGQWQAAFEQRIADYVAAVQARLDTPAGFADCVRLADSRRRELRKRPLAEFPLLLPRTNIPEDAPFLEMTEDGEIRPKP